MDLQLPPVFAQFSPSNCKFLPWFGEVSSLSSLPASQHTERSRRQLLAAPGAVAQSQVLQKGSGWWYPPSALCHQQTKPKG